MYIQSPVLIRDRLLKTIAEQPLAVNHIIEGYSTYNIQQ